MLHHSDMSLKKYGNQQHRLIKKICAVKGSTILDTETFDAVALTPVVLKNIFNLLFT